MSISGNYIQLQQQVADELGDRTDLMSPLADSGLVLSPVQNAIQSAIAKWEREPFWFLESYQTLFNTNGNIPPGFNGQEFYTVADGAGIASAARIVKLRVLVDGQRYTLEPRTWQYLEDVSVNPQVTSSYPSDWSYFAETIRLYPIPSQAMPVQASYDQRLTNLENESDSNVWTQDAYDLIRTEAKLILAREVLHDAGIVSECQAAIYGTPGVRGERGYLYALKAESTRRGGRGKIRPTHF